ncbi:MAG: NAD-dependent epimerase/dehydratase family protein [Alphaproteobacteria bacterium]|nr:NAD-dependent epimerase/dehydratase family protein [Alphaproteobacteria bacterium]
MTNRGSRILVLGGTGSIGAAVVAALVRRGHQVTGLARSEASARRLSAMGARSIAGDIAAPAGWIDRLAPMDAVVHAAADFASDMNAVETGLLDALLPALGRIRPKPRFVYTSGCWLYGATGDRVADETTPFDPLPAFAWMVPNLGRVLASDDVDGVVVHPAMVYAGHESVFRRFAGDARAGRPIRAVGGAAVRWPLVHRDDLAALYALALERGGRGESYCGASVDGMAVGTIAAAARVAACAATR